MIFARRSLRKDESGSAVVEFSLVALPLFLLITAVVELSMIAFIHAAMESAALEASRFGSTGGLGGGATREDRVLEIIEEQTLGFVDRDNAVIDALVYPSFEEIGAPEPYTDANANGEYDDGEFFDDINGSGGWDADMGAAGLGGPNDVVVYNVAWSWGILLPMVMEYFDGITLTASVAIRNEPY